MRIPGASTLRHRLAPTEPTLAPEPTAVSKDRPDANAIAVRAIDTGNPHHSVQDDLIFDIGLHRGFDARFYLRKGFRVVGLEARADLCEIARQNNREFIADGRLSIVSRALFDVSGTSVDFYVNDEKDDWGSLFRGAAEADGREARVITVATITLAELFETYGTPYYIKCDIEAGDALFIDQLLQSDRRPPYVSAEMSDQWTSPDSLAKLRASGYTSFQIVNQQLNPSTLAPDPPREGVYVDQDFTYETSGLFGRELPEDSWLDFRTTMKRLLDWYDLRDRDRALALGWLDVHARID
jgi:FkbM family methyltransferase